jgi:CRP-like cAMP-binding protein
LFQARAGKAKKKMILPKEPITRWHEGTRIRAVEMRADFPGCKVVIFQVGEVLFREGSKADTCFLIEKGTVRITKKISGRKSLLMGFSRAGDYLGEIALLSRQPRGATATAKTAVTAVSFRRAALVEGLRQQNSMATRLSLELCSLLSRRCLRLTRLLARHSVPTKSYRLKTPQTFRRPALRKFLNRWAV